MRPILWSLALLTAVGRGSAEEPPAGQPQQPPVAVEAPPTPVDGSPHTLPQGRPRGAARAARPDPKLGVLRAVEIREGEATLVFADGRRTLRPGDVVFGDKVESVEPGRIVFSRPNPRGGPAAIVIVRFDGGGRGHVKVYSVVDTSPAAPPRPPGE